MLTPKRYSDTPPVGAVHLLSTGRFFPLRWANKKPLEGALLHDKGNINFTAESRRPRSDAEALQRHVAQGATQVNAEIADDARRRREAQMPMDEKKKYGRVVIDNRGTEAELDKQVRELWEKEIMNYEG